MDVGFENPVWLLVFGLTEVEPLGRREIAARAQGPLPD